MSANEGESLWDIVDRLIEAQPDPTKVSPCCYAEAALDELDPERKAPLPMRHATFHEVENLVLGMVHGAGPKPFFEGSEGRARQSEASSRRPELTASGRWPVAAKRST